MPGEPPRRFNTREAIEGPNAPPPPSCRCHACKSVRKCPCGKGCRCAAAKAERIWKDMTHTQQVAYANGTSTDLEVLRALIEHDSDAERYLHQSLGAMLNDPECPEWFFDRMVRHHRQLRAVLGGMVHKYDEVRAGLLVDAGEGGDEEGEAALVAQGRIPEEVEKTGRAFAIPDIDPDSEEILSRYAIGMRRRPEHDEDLDRTLQRYRLGGRSALDEGQASGYGGH
jgi:hypothetical protein